VNQLSDIDQALSKKLEEVDKASLLVSGILQGDEKYDFKPLHDQRAEARSQLITGIQKEIPDKPSTRKRKTPKERKSKTKDGLSTYEITWQMILDGKTVKEIAEVRELTAGTIEGHLAKAVEAGRINIYQFMNDQTVAEIASAIAQLPKEFSSKDLFASMKGKYGYGQLRAVMAHVKLKKE
jgi:uncharacterized protein YpbB